MEILLGGKEDGVRLSEIEKGQCFFFDGFLYIVFRLGCHKLTFDKPKGTIPVLNLKSGTMRLLRATSRVARAPAVIYLEDTGFGFMRNHSPEASMRGGETNG